MRPIIYPYRMGSSSARALSNSLRDLRCMQVHSNKRYKYFRNHKIINWGNSENPNWNTSIIDWVNKPANVAVAQDKLLSLQQLGNAEISVPPFTTSRETAQRWIANDHVIFARTMLRGSQGRGIRVIKTHLDMINAPLYTSEIKGPEYRIHIFNGELLDYQRKRRRQEFHNNNVELPYVKNLENGYVYCRENLAHIQENIDMAINAVHALGLEFGAVDIIRDKIARHSFVLEVNTAPGLEGTTLQKYSNKIREIIC